MIVAKMESCYINPILSLSRERGSDVNRPPKYNKKQEQEEIAFSENPPVQKPVTI